MRCADQGFGIGPGVSVTVIGTHAYLHERGSTAKGRVCCCGETMAGTSEQLVSIPMGTMHVYDRNGNEIPQPPRAPSSVFPGGCVYTGITLKLISRIRQIPP